MQDLAAAVSSAPGRQRHADLSPCADTSASVRAGLVAPRFRERLPSGSVAEARRHAEEERGALTDVVEDLEKASEGGDIVEVRHMSSLGR